MDLRHALWLAGSVLLALAAQLLARSAPPARPAGPPPPRCHRWVQVGPPERPLLCLDRRPATRLRAAGVSLSCLRRHPPATLRSGDRLLGPRRADCQRGRMPAANIDVLGIPVDLNRAGAAELATLPGIGPRLARRILRHRQRHGPFQSAEALLQVSGIGHRLLGRVRTRIRPTPAHR